MRAASDWFTRELVVIALIVISGCSAMNASKVYVERQQNAVVPAVKQPIQIKAQFAGSTPFIPVRVNGRGPFWFILDTGANSCVLADSLAGMLGLAPLSADVGSSGGSPMGYRKYAHDAVVFEVGLARFACEHVISVDLSGQPAVLGRAVDGILGSDFIAQFVVELDYDQQRVTLRDKNTFEYDGNGVELPLTFNRRVPYLEAEIEIDGRPPERRQLLIDTGSQDAVDDSLVLASQKPHTETQGGGGEGARIAVTTGTLDRVHIGGFEFQNVPSVAPGPALVGGEVLRRFLIVFDYERKRMYMKPGREIGATFPPIGTPE
jgi:predicted aspartyl protease